MEDTLQFARCVGVSSRTKLTNTLKSQLRGRLVLTYKRRSSATPAQLRKLWIEQTGSVPEHVERLLVVVEALDLQIRDAEKQMRTLVASPQRDLQEVDDGAGRGPDNSDAIRRDARRRNTVRDSTRRPSRTSS